MTWKSILGALIRCEISASRDCLGNFRVSAKGAIAVILLWLFLITLTGNRQRFLDVVEMPASAHPNGEHHAGNPHQ